MSKDFAALTWLVEMGADEAIADAPVDRFAPRAASPVAAAVEAPRAVPPAAPAIGRKAPPPLAAPGPAASPLPALPPASAEAAASARARAAAAGTLAELEQAVRSFEGCGLKATATSTVFADGVPGAPVMLVGEAPGADEDRLGRPFVGVSGQLLDRMLGWIDLDRQRNVYIANVIYWRPPGNRTPTTNEVAICLPFIQRQIELAQPEVLVFLGASAANALLGQSGAISRLRGRWLAYQPAGASRPVQAMATFHPAYLLRSPGQKRESWRDLLMIKNKLSRPDK
jgi:uracil-DNA glycosylase family 4